VKAPKYDAERQIEYATSESRIFFLNYSKLSNHKNGSSRKQEADIQRGMHSPIKINEAFL